MTTRCSGRHGETNDRNQNQKQSQNARTLRIDHNSPPKRFILIDLQARRRIGTPFGPIPRGIRLWQPWATSEIAEQRREANPNETELAITWCEGARIKFGVSEGTIGSARLQSSIGVDHMSEHRLVAKGYNCAIQ